MKYTKVPEIEDQLVIHWQYRGFFKIVSVEPFVGIGYWAKGFYNVKLVRVYDKNGKRKYGEEIYVERANSFVTASDYVESREAELNTELEKIQKEIQKINLVKQKITT